MGLSVGWAAGPLTYTHRDEWLVVRHIYLSGATKRHAWAGWAWPLAAVHIAAYTPRLKGMVVRDA